MRLEKDPLLAKRLSLKKAKITVGELLKDLKKQTPLSLSTVLEQQYACGCEEIPLSALMDAIAALDELRWKKKETGYELVQSFYTGTESDDPLNSLYNREGMKMIHEFLKLPKETRDLLKSGMSLSQLPEKMYPPMFNTVNAQYNSERTKPGESIDAKPSDFSRERIRIYVEEVESDGNFNQYKVQYSAPGMSAGYTVSDYAEKRETHDREKAKNNDDPAFPLYEAISSEVPPSKARQQKELNRLVKIELRGVQFPEVLASLAEKYSVPFVCNVPLMMPQKATVRLAEMPLYRALDRLTRIYDETEWEWRRLGFIVVRGPSNPSRIRHQRTR
jgi:hypothetical protein